MENNIFGWWVHSYYTAEWIQDSVQYKYTGLNQQIILIVYLKYLYSFISILLAPCCISRSRALCNKARLRLLQVLTNIQAYTTNAIWNVKKLRTRKTCIAFEQKMKRHNQVVIKSKWKEFLVLWYNFIFLIRTMR